MSRKRKRSIQDTPVTATAPPKKQQKTPAKYATPPISLDASPFVDNPKGSDLKREVQLYDLLSSEDSAQRLLAANAIVSGLLGEDGVEESTLQRHLERRLFRGLASGRKGARLGFSVVITEILGQLFGLKNLAQDKYAGLSFEKVLGFLVAKTKPEGDLSGQEEKDHALGLLFGLQSFVRAKILFREEVHWNIILGKLLDLSKKKPWMREECGWVIVEALAQMEQAQAEFTIKELHDAGLSLSPEGVGVWLTARNRFPDMKFPSKPWGQSGNPLEHLKSLGKALKESSSRDDDEKGQQAKQTGNWNPQLHFVWNIVLEQYAKGLKNEAHGIKSDFENFWKVAVDASRERKFWGFLVFQKVVQNVELYSKFLPTVFSHNLVRCLINHVQEKDRFLNRAAEKSLKVVVQSVEENPQILLVILPKIIGGNGMYNFDKVTKTKTIEKLLAMFDGSNAKEVVNILIEPTIAVSSSEGRDAEMRRQMLGDYLLNLIRRVETTETTEETTWVKHEVLPRLAHFAYSKDKSCTPEVSEKTRTLFRNRLMSAFAHLLSDLNGVSYPCDLLLALKPDAVAMDSGIMEAKDSAISTMQKLLKKAKKSSGKDKSPYQALALLYSLAIFQLYNGEPEAVSILEELKLCYDKLIKHKESEDSDVEASEVLVELLLSFISKPSALLRKVTQHVFSAFMGEITAGGLKLMTDVLDSSEGLRGQQGLFDQEQDDEAQMDVDDSDLGSDVEVVDLDGDKGLPHEHLDEDSDDDNEEEDEQESEAEDDEEAKKLDDALAKALGTHRLAQDLQEEHSDSDADMTDSEMMALDSKLVEIFSQRKKIPNKKQEHKDAKETMVNFKARVLDLLEIYVKKQATNPLAFELLIPLLQLTRTTKTKQLAEKSHNIILSFAKSFKSLKKAERAAEINSSEQIKLLKAIHQEATKDYSHMFAKATSTASLLVASSLYNTDEGSVKEVATVYRDSQVKWVTGEVTIQAAFFVEWVNWCQSHAKS
ncbi:hypothetical protein B7494_g2456 [Chlorociboria aeruginascens]|nr:hypothetical protein B7494_g2456 [Chlorociboria aeruginascens]